MDSGRPGFTFRGLRTGDIVVAVLLLLLSIKRQKFTGLLRRGPSTVSSISRPIIDVRHLVTLYDCVPHDLNPRIRFDMNLFGCDLLFLYQPWIHPLKKDHNLKLKSVLIHLLHVYTDSKHKKSSSKKSTLGWDGFNSGMMHQKADLQ